MKPTPSQTVGPFFAVGLARLVRTEIAPPGVPGERVTVEGRVIEAGGQPVPDAFLEIWQADAAGHYAHPADTGGTGVEGAFVGFGRVPTDGEGRFHFATIKPGAVPGPGGAPQAPHLAVSVFARGLMRRLITRMYFPDEAANATDFALRLVEPARRATLMAKREGPAGVLSWDVVLQGPAETVFFDC